MLIMMMVSIKFSLYLLAPLLDSLGVVCLCSSAETKQLW